MRADLTGARHTGGVPDTPPLGVDGLTRSYGRLVGLDGLDLTLKAGECVALIGANGSGKSTAIRTIAGLLEPSGGTVRICGHDPHTEPDAEEARAALALVPDTPLLYDDLTVRQHLELVGARPRRRSTTDTPARIDALLDRLGLTERADFLPTELSRGMRQKTGLACALIRPAELLMLDEPVVGLDPPSQTLLGELLLDAKADGKAVLLTTHQMCFADGVADRAIVLGEGGVLDRGRGRTCASAPPTGWLPEMPNAAPRRARRDVRRSGAPCRSRPASSSGWSPSTTCSSRRDRRPVRLRHGEQALAEVATPRGGGHVGPVAGARRLLALVRWGAVQGPVVFSVADVAQLLGAPLRRAELVTRAAGARAARGRHRGRRRGGLVVVGLAGTAAASRAARAAGLVVSPRSLGMLGIAGASLVQGRGDGIARPGWRAGRPRAAAGLVVAGLVGPTGRRSRCGAGRGAGRSAVAGPRPPRAVCSPPAAPATAARAARRGSARPSGTSSARRRATARAPPLLLRLPLRRAQPGTSARARAAGRAAAAAPPSPRLASPGATPWPHSAPRSASAGARRSRRGGNAVCLSAAPPAAVPAARSRLRGPALLEPLRAETDKPSRVRVFLPVTMGRTLLRDHAVVPAGVVLAAAALATAGCAVAGALPPSRRGGGAAQRARGDAGDHALRRAQQPARRTAAAERPGRHLRRHDRHEQPHPRRLGRGVPGAGDRASTPCP